MPGWRELRSLAVAHVRRFERAPSEPWEHEALRLARAWLALFDRDDVTCLDTAPLLFSAASLPTRDGSGLRKLLMRTHLELPRGGFVPNAVTVGDLVIDAHGRLAVIARRAPTPSTDWLAAQEVAPPRGEISWWTAWPLDGGAVLLPEPQVFGLGRADLDRCWELVEYATVDQVRELLTIVPELANRRP